MSSTESILLFDRRSSLIDSFWTLHWLTWLVLSSIVLVDRDQHRCLDQRKDACRQVHRGRSGDIDRKRPILLPTVIKFDDIAFDRVKDMQVYIAYPLPRKRIKLLYL